MTGNLGDKFNKRKLLTGSFLVQAFFFVIIGFAEERRMRTPLVYHICFGIIGLAQSFVFPCLVSAIGAWFSRKRRGVATGGWGTCTNMGNILGLQSAAWLLQSFHWDVLMYLIAVYFVIDALLIWFFFSPEPSLHNIIIELDEAESAAVEQTEAPIEAAVNEQEPLLDENATH